MAEEVNGGISGAAQGAATGAAIGGPVGAVVGGVIGGILGIFGGSKAKKARKYANKAQLTQRQQEQLAAGIQRRDMIREARIARAQAVAASAVESGGLQSSAPQGAIGSLGSQTTSNLSYFDNQVGLGNLAFSYNQKAGKYARQSQSIFGLMDAGSSILSTFGGFKPSAPTPGAPPYTKGPATTVGIPKMPTIGK